MTTTTPVIVANEAPAITTIDHLDFDIICGVESPKCSTEANWWVIANSHCVPDTTRSGFMCEDHFERLMNGDLFRCAVCGEHEVSFDRVIRTERIR